MTNIFVSKIPQTFDIQRSVEAFKNGFPASGNEKYLDGILQKKSDAAKALSLYAMYILLAGLSILKTDTESLTLKKTPNGKPYFENEELHFSISHDKDSVCVAISDSNIGVDMQSERPSLRDGKISNRYFADSEKAQICDNKITPLSLWTRKEAYVKLCDIALPDVISHALPDDVFFASTTWKEFEISLASYGVDEISVFEI